MILQIDMNKLLEILKLTTKITHLPGQPSGILVTNLPYLHFDTSGDSNHYKEIQY